MHFTQNEVQIILEALFYGMAVVVNAPRNPRAWRGAKKTLRLVKSYGQTMENLRFENELSDEDWSNIIPAFTLFCDESLFMPDEISTAYALAEKVDLNHTRLATLALE